MAEQDARTRLTDMTTGHGRAQAIIAAAELGLADRMASGETTLAQLARATGAHPPALRRLLRYLVSIGLFQEHGGHYRPTALGDLLRSDVDGSLRPRLRVAGHFARAWAEILHAVRTPESGFVKAYGKPLFAYLQEHPHLGSDFDAVMTTLHGAETPAMLAVTDLSAAACVADIGGGNGSQLVEVLRRYPGLRGILFDLPQVVARAAKVLRRSDVARRLDPQGGDFFEAVPAGADVYLLRHILHDWDDDACLRILENCRAVLPPRGRVLVVELVVPEDNEPSPAKEFDLSMLVLLGGMERTAAEYRALFARAGLELTAITPTTAGVCVIEARAADA